MAWRTVAPSKGKSARMERVTDRPPQASRASGQAHASSSPPTGMDDKRAEQLRLEMVMFAQHAQHSGGDPDRHKYPPEHWDWAHNSGPPLPNPRVVLGGEDGWEHAVDSRIEPNDSERGGVGRDVRARSDPPPEHPPRGTYRGANVEGATGGGRNNATAGSHTGNVGSSNGINAGGYSSGGNSGSVATRQGSGDVKPSWDARVKVSQLCLIRADCQSVLKLTCWVCVRVELSWALH